MGQMRHELIILFTRIFYCFRVYGIANKSLQFKLGYCNFLNIHLLQLSLHPN